MRGATGQGEHSMDETGQETGDVGPDLALLVASGLLPEGWPHDPAQAGLTASTRPALEGFGAGSPVPADHKSYLHDLVAESSWSAIEAGASLGFDPHAGPRALEWLRRTGIVIGLPRASGIVYPRFQFDSESRRVYRVAAVVNVWLGTASDPYAAAVWWLRPGPDGLRPRDLIGTPDERRVIDLAAAHISGRVLGGLAGREHPPRGQRRVIGGQAGTDYPRERPVVSPEAAPTASASDVSPAPIEPIPRGPGIFGRHPRHA